MAIKLAKTQGAAQAKQGARIIWKGTRIAKVIFASGKIVEFES